MLALAALAVAGGTTDYLLQRPPARALVWPGTAGPGRAEAGTG